MEHFMKRLYACIVDAVVVSLMTALVNNLLFIPLSFLSNLVISAYYPYITTVIVTMLYFTLYEARTNKTLGKKIFHLYVSDEEGYMTYTNAFIRNLTKIFWIPLIFDVILGKILNLPSRLFDKFAGTDVYADSELEDVDEEELEEELEKEQ